MNKPNLNAYVGILFKLTWNYFANNLRLSNEKIIITDLIDIISFSFPRICSIKLSRCWSWSHHVIFSRRLIYGTKYTSNARCNVHNFNIMHTIHIYAMTKSLKLLSVEKEMNILVVCRIHKTIIKITLPRYTFCNQIYWMWKDNISNYQFLAILLASSLERVMLHNKSQYKYLLHKF